MGAKKSGAIIISENKALPPSRKRYHEDYAIHVFKLCLLGATTKMVAAYFDIAVTTVQKWQKRHPEFAQAMARGKKAADMEVAHSLYQSTLDRIITLRQAVKCKEVFYDEKGKRVEKERVEVVTVEKHIPADYRAQQFWLRNRAPEHWGLKHDDSEGNKPFITLDLGSGQNPEFDEIAE